MTELDSTVRKKKLLGGKNEARERIRVGENKSRLQEASLAQKKSQAGSVWCQRAMVRGPESKTESSSLTGGNWTKATQLDLARGKENLDGCKNWDEPKSSSNENRNRERSYG
jgi:hypothetical protein